MAKGKSLSTPGMSSDDWCEVAHKGWIHSSDGEKKLDLSDKQRKMAWAKCGKDEAREVASSIVEGIRSRGVSEQYYSPEFDSMGRSHWLGTAAKLALGGIATMGLYKAHHAAADDEQAGQKLGTWLGKGVDWYGTKVRTSRENKAKRDAAKETSGSITSSVELPPQASLVLDMLEQSYPTGHPMLGPYPVPVHPYDPELLQQPPSSKLKTALKVGVPLALLAGGLAATLHGGEGTSKNPIAKASGLLGTTSKFRQANSSKEELRSHIKAGRAARAKAAAITTAAATSGKALSDTDREQLAALHGAAVTALDTARSTALDIGAQHHAAKQAMKWEKQGSLPSAASNTGPDEREKRLSQGLTGPPTSSGLGLIGRALTKPRELKNPFSSEERARKAAAKERTQARAEKVQSSKAKRAELYKASQRLQAKYRGGYYSAMKPNYPIKDWIEARYPLQEQGIDPRLDPSQMQSGPPQQVSAPPPQQGLGVIQNPFMRPETFDQHPTVQGHGAYNYNPSQIPAEDPGSLEAQYPDITIPAVQLPAPSFQLHYGQAAMGSDTQHPLETELGQEGGMNPPVMQPWRPELSPNPAQDIYSPENQQDYPGPVGAEGEGDQDMMDPSMPAWMQRRYRRKDAYAAQAEQQIGDPVGAILREEVSLGIAVDGYLEHLKQSGRSQLLEYYTPNGYPPQYYPPPYAKRPGFLRRAARWALPALGVAGLGAFAASSDVRKGVGSGLSQGASWAAGKIAPAPPAAPAAQGSEAAPATTTPAAPADPNTAAVAQPQAPAEQPAQGWGDWARTKTSSGLNRFAGWSSGWGSRAPAATPATDPGQPQVAVSPPGPAADQSQTQQQPTQTAQQQAPQQPTQAPSAAPPPAGPTGAQIAQAAARLGQAVQSAAPGAQPAVSTAPTKPVRASATAQPQFAGRGGSLGAVPRGTPRPAAGVARQHPPSNHPAAGTHQNAQSAASPQQKPADYGAKTIGGPQAWYEKAGNAVRGLVSRFRRRPSTVRSPVRANYRGGLQHSHHDWLGPDDTLVMDSERAFNAAQKIVETIRAEGTWEGAPRLPFFVQGVMTEPGSLEELTNRFVDSIHEELLQEQLPYGYHPFVPQQHLPPAFGGPPPPDMYGGPPPAFHPPPERPGFLRRWAPKAITAGVLGLGLYHLGKQSGKEKPETPAATPSTEPAKVEKPAYTPKVPPHVVKSMSSEDGKQYQAPTIKPGSSTPTVSAPKAPDSKEVEEKPLTDEIRKHLAEDPHYKGSHHASAFNKQVDLHNTSSAVPGIVNEYHKGAASSVAENPKIPTPKVAPGSEGWDAEVQGYADTLRQAAAPAAAHHFQGNERGLDPLINDMAPLHLKVKHAAATGLANADQFYGLSRTEASRLNTADLHARAFGLPDLFGWAAPAAEAPAAPAQTAAPPVATPPPQASPAATIGAAAATAATGAATPAAAQPVQPAPTPDPTQQQAPPVPQQQQAPPAPQQQTQPPPQQPPEAPPAPPEAAPAPQGPAPQPQGQPVPPAPTEQPAQPQAGQQVEGPTGAAGDLHKLLQDKIAAGQPLVDDKTEGLFNSYVAYGMKRGDSAYNANKVKTHLAIVNGITALPPDQMDKAKAFVSMVFDPNARRDPTELLKKYAEMTPATIKELQEHGILKGKLPPTPPGSGPGGGAPRPVPGGSTAAIGAAITSQFKPPPGSPQASVNPEQAGGPRPAPQPVSEVPQAPPVEVQAGKLSSKYPSPMHRMVERIPASGSGGASSHTSPEGFTIKYNDKAGPDPANDIPYDPETHGKLYDKLVTDWTANADFMKGKKPEALEKDLKGLGLSETDAAKARLLMRGVMRRSPGQLGGDLYDVASGFRNVVDKHEDLLKDLVDQGLLSSKKSDTLDLDMAKSLISPGTRAKKVDLQQIEDQLSSPLPSKGNERERDNAIAKLAAKHGLSQTEADDLETLLDYLASPDHKKPTFGGRSQVRLTTIFKDLSQSGALDKLINRGVLGSKGEETPAGSWFHSGHSQTSTNPDFDLGKLASPGTATSMRKIMGAAVTAVPHRMAEEKLKQENPELLHHFRRWNQLRQDPDIVRASSDPDEYSRLAQTPEGQKKIRELFDLDRDLHVGGGYEQAIRVKNPINAEREAKQRTKEQTTKARREVLTNHFAGSRPVSLTMGGQIHSHNPYKAEGDAASNVLKDLGVGSTYQRLAPQDLQQLAARYFDNHLNDPASLARFASPTTAKINPGNIDKASEFLQKVLQDPQARAAWRNRFITKVRANLWDFLLHNNYVDFNGAVSGAFKEYMRGIPGSNVSPEEGGNVIDHRSSRGPLLTEHRVIPNRVIGRSVYNLFSRA